MSNLNNDGATFPGEQYGAWEWYDTGKGMSLRDYFAAHAPITLDDARDVMESTGRTSFTWEELIDTLAQMRVKYADTMLKEREK